MALAAETEPLVDLLSHALTRGDGEFLAVALKAARKAGIPISELLSRAVERPGILLVEPLVHLGRQGHAQELNGLLGHREVRVSVPAAAAVKELIDRGNGAPEPLCPSTAREELLEALFLDRTPAPEDLPELISLLADGREAIRRLSVRALIRMRSLAAAPLFLAIEAQKLPSTLELVTLLASLGDARGVAVVRPLLQNGSLGSAAIRALEAIGCDEAIDELVALLESNQWRAREAGEALQRIGGPAALRFLSAFSARPALRRRQGEWLARVAGVKALDALIAGLGDRYRLVRLSAEAGLKALGLVAVEPLLRLVASGETDAREHAMRVLGEIGAPRAVDVLAARMDAGTAEERIVAVEALGGIAGEHAAEALTRALGSHDRRVRLGAAAQLGRHRDVANRRGLLRALKNPDVEVRKQAVKSLRYDRDPSVVSGMIEALTDAPDVGAAAAQNLEDIGSAALDAVSRAASMANAEARTRLERLAESIALAEARRFQGGLEGLKAALVCDDVGHGTRELPHPTPTLPEPVRDNVHFSVVGPPSVRPGDEFVLELWAHLEAYGGPQLLERLRPGDTLLRTKGPTLINRGTTMRVRLSLPGLGAHDLEDTLYWSERRGNASFSTRVPADARAGIHVGTISVFVGDLLIAKIYFDIEVGNATEESDDITSSVRRLRSAFASYASEDRDRVLGRIQGMLKLLPNLEIFLDVLSLRSGESWESRIAKEIAARDVFYLFWSGAASRSPWVEKEWRTALVEKGLDGIDPVPLEPPSQAPPPPELSSLHFNEWTLTFEAPG